MTLEILLAFIAYAIVGSITPGPNNMMVMASALNYGFERTIPHILGIVFGFGLMVFLAGIGLLSILDNVPYLYNALHIVSIMYLLYLAWKIATAKPLSSDPSTQKPPMNFWKAVGFQWVNPKALVMAMAAITTYVPETPESAFMINVTIISVLYALVTLPCVGAWAMFGKGFRRFLKNPLYYRIFNVTMAILLVMSLYPLFAEVLAY